MLRRVWVVQQREAYYRHISFREHEHKRHEDAVIPPSALVEARRDTSRLKQRRGAFRQCIVPAGGIFVLVTLGREAAVVEDQLWPRAARQGWYGLGPVRRDQQYRGRSVFVPAQELHHRCVRRVAQQGHGPAAMGDEEAAAAHHM